MARVTVEDCLERIDNHFALVVLGAERARQIAAGAPSLVICTNKPAVTALREIGAGKVRFKENVADTVRAFVTERKQIDGETRIATKQRRHGGTGHSHSHG
jgi:DNA-directed RNA polymerase subunit omega